MKMLSVGLGVVVAITGCRSSHPQIDNIFATCKQAMALVDAGDMDGFLKTRCAGAVRYSVKEYRYETALIQFPEEVYAQDEPDITLVVNICRDIDKFLDNNKEIFFRDRHFDFPGPVALALFAEIYPTGFYREHCRVYDGGRITCDKNLPNSKWGRHGE